MRSVLPSRPGHRVLFIALLVSVLSACGLDVRHEISVVPGHVTLSEVTLSRPVTISYAGPPGATVAVSASVSDERLFVSPTSVVIGANGSATVTIGARPSSPGTRFSGLVRFSGARVDDVSVTVTFEPGCFIEPDGPVPAAHARTLSRPHGLAHVPDELLVSYREVPAGRASAAGTATAERSALAEGVAQAAGVEIRRLGSGGEHDLIAVPAHDLDAAAARLRADPRVLHVSRNYLAMRLVTPDDRHYEAQWYLRDFGLEAAWDVEDASGRGDDVVIAIIDDGLNVDHVDFTGKLLPGRDVYCGDGDVRAISDHGTHVAGIAAAGSRSDGLVVGVAKGERARILAVKVFPDDTAMSGNLDSVIRGMRWAARLSTQDGVALNPHPADVINLSLGFETALSSSAVALLQNTANAIAARGIAIVAAAGNQGVSSGVTYPARLERVIAVGSVDWEFRRSPFSNHGAHLDLMAPGGSAPGTASDDPVCLAGDGRHRIVGAGAEDDRAVLCLAGTSMASPFVAGTIALLIAHDPDTYRGAPEAILDRLIATALQPESIYDPSQHGQGIVCPDAALGLAARCTVEPP
jgi:serine protease